MDTLEAALAAIAAGADRIELCGRLDAGGVTPSVELLTECRARTTRPIFVMIRPHKGDFSWTRAEQAMMLGDIARARELGADGIVLGALRRDRSVDEPLVRKLVAAADGLQTTFHRAFDDTRDPEAALQALSGLGIGRILTSGQAPTAAEGTVLLRRLIELAAGRITIVPGGGVSGDNVGRILDETGAREVHARSGADAARILGIIAALRR